ncbi:MAG: copper chaperone PCu(A)C [Rhizobiales bacterium]|nr:copper chaperone PCu(A)C [Hyphomicrobiales bacterium]MBN9008779.1 copper chaperone PCu(A)C [Hyphomicrobiales bacterium]
MLRLLAAAAAALVIAALPASAHELKLGDLVITDLWTRATPAGAPAAGGYLTIANNGTEQDMLRLVASPEAAKAELHIMQMKDGVMTMRPVEGGIVIPAGGKVELSPDGYHIMFIGPKEQLKEGGKFPVSLTFTRAGTVSTFLHILAIGAKGPAPMGGMGAMNHDAMGGMKMDNGQ